MPHDDTWHDKEEAFLLKLENQANVYAKYFNKDYIYYHKLSARFNIPILIISALNALSAIALNDFLPQKFVSILNAVLSSGTGVLGSIQLYMKINEKMTNAIRTHMLMKRLGLKISKELSVDRISRSTDGQVFLQECFGEFNAALEQANPIEKKLTNHLALDKELLTEEVKFGNFFKGASNIIIGALSPRKTNKPVDDSPKRDPDSSSERKELPYDSSPVTPYEEP
jgi:hypothetical protein